MTQEWWETPVATTGDEVRRRHEANRACWDQAAVHYTARVAETIRLLRDGGSSLHPVERGLLGDLRGWCRRAVHLQCASGRDTLSLWREGAGEVVGIDISPVHIDNARRAASALDAPASWHCCDVLDAPHELDATADLVYTGRGAICWIHDIHGWARVVARLLAPGGLLALFDDHPASFLFDPDLDHLAYSGTAYFDASSAGRGWSPGYIADLLVPDDQLAVWHDRTWTLGEIFAALRRAGLVVEHLGEHPEPYYDAFPRLPRELQRRIPQTFSLLARRPRDAA